MSTAPIDRTARKPVAIGLAAAVALGGALSLAATSPAAAAPLSLNQLAVKEAAPGDVIDVRRHGRRHFRGHRFHGHRFHGHRFHRHRHYGGYAAAGLALGIIGSAIAAQHYYGAPHYAPYGYYYGAPPCIRRHGALYCRY